MMKAEIFKLKKDFMFFIGTIIVVAIPIFILVKDTYFSTSPKELLNWIMSCCLIDFLILSVISGFIITNLIQREYQAGTLINILTSSVSRTAFVISKLIIWFLWYSIMLIIIIAITIFGSKIIYPTQFNPQYIKLIIELFSKFGVLIFFSFIPLLWVSFMQKKLFYPSILTAMGFTAIWVGGMNTSLEMILPACLVPWSAVSIIAMNQIGSPYIQIGLTSVILVGLIGLFLSCFSFNKQDQ